MRRLHGLTGVSGIFARKRPEPEPDPALWRRPGSAAGLDEALNFRRSPMLWSAVWFALGILIETQIGWRPVVLWLPACLLLGGVTLFALRAPSGWVRLVPVAGLWLVIGFGCGEIQPAPPPQTALQGFADGLSRTVRGRIARVRVLAPQTGSPDADTNDGRFDTTESERPSPISFDLALDAIEEVTPDVSRMVPIDGGVRATLLVDPAMTTPSLQCGDHIEVPMRLRVPERYLDPGAWQYADYLLDQGIGVHATVQPRRLKFSAEPQTWRSKLAMHGGLRCRLYAAQGWAAERMTRYSRSGVNRRLPPMLRLTAADAGMIDAMLFGDRAGLNHTLRLGFERTGSFHLFVVSGMHLGLIALGLMALARRMRLPPWAATFATIILTTAYAALTGFGIPVQRALWMASIFLLARLLDRSRNTLNALGIAVLAVLVWSPSSLFEASFQMTFLALVSIAGIAMPLGERSFLRYARATRRIDDSWQDVLVEPRVAQFRVMLRMADEAVGLLCAVTIGGRVGRFLDRGIRAVTAHLPSTLVRWIFWALELCLIGVVTEMVMALPMAVYFHRAVLFALPANLLTIPVIVVLVPLAIATFVASLASAWAAAVPGAVTAALLHGLTGAVGHLSRLALADLRVPAPAGWVCLLAVGALGFCCWAARRPGAMWGWAVVVLLPLTATMILWPEPALTTPGVLEVTAIDVGQGDSLLVVGPSGAAMLVDAGGPIGGPGQVNAQTSGGFDVGEEVVAPYLWSRRLRRLDVVALTHEHSDHMGGMPAVLEAFRPRELWVGDAGAGAPPGNPCPPPAYRG
jgi:competence protein ComEC